MEAAMDSVMWNNQKLGETGARCCSRGYLGFTKPSKAFLAVFWSKKDLASPGCLISITSCDRRRGGGHSTDGKIVVWVGSWQEQREGLQWGRFLMDLELYLLGLMGISRANTVLGRGGIGPTQPEVVFFKERGLAHWFLVFTYPVIPLDC